MDHLIKFVHTLMELPYMYIIVNICVNESMNFGYYLYKSANLGNKVEVINYVVVAYLMCSKLSETNAGYILVLFIMINSIS